MNAQLDDAPPFPPDEAYFDEPALQSASVVPLKREAPAEPEKRTGEKVPEIGPLAVLWFATLNEIRHHDHLVKGLLLAQTLFVVFGESNSGKTFWVLDLCLALASRRLWRGRKTKGGLVIYVALEGAASVKMRVTAYRKANPDVPASTPFAIFTESFDLLDRASVDRLIARARAAQSECGEPIVAIIFDTFARSMPGGDENSAQDVGMVVASGDRIRTELKCAVGFIHHAGKDPTKGARGSSALRAACDTEILIEGQSGPRTVTFSKQRDLEPDKAMSFELIPLPVGVDPDDDTEVFSCVVQHMTDVAPQPAPSPQSRQGSGKNQQLALGAITEWARTITAQVIGSDELASLLKAQGIADRKRRHEMIKHLVDVGVLTPSVGGHTVNRGAL
jgi:hypothetical protein